MELILIFYLGASHGVQPDHAVAAAALGARWRVPAWVAALRLALGHCLALGMLAVVASFLPFVGSVGAQRGITLAGAGGLILLGGALLRGVWKNAPSHHSHEHTSHRRSTLAVAFGWLLGMSGLRILVLLPLMAGPYGAVSGLAAYSLGIAAGIACTGIGLDWLRRVSRGWVSHRFVDGVLALAAVASGCWLLIGVGRA